MAAYFKYVKSKYKKMEPHTCSTCAKSAEIRLMCGGT